MPDSQNVSKKETRDQLRARLNEVRESLSRWKVEWLRDGVERPRHERAALELERDSLVSRLFSLDVDIHQDNKMDSELREASFLFTLLALLKERGLSDVVKEARRLSNEHILDLAL